MRNIAKQLSLAALLAACAFVGSRDAAAFGGRVANRPDGCGQTCCYTVPSKTDSGDEFYGPMRWKWCRSAYLKTNASLFGLTYATWKDHGWNDACNTDKPMGRFFTSLIALTETSPDKAWPDVNDTDGNLLRWGAGWASRVYSELNASCAYNGNTAIATTTDIGLKKYTALWVPNNFYGNNRQVVLRASTLIHEAAHVNGKRHNASGGRDTDWDYRGAWTYQAAWLGQYAAFAVNAPLAQKCVAKDRGNQILTTQFETAPTIRFRFPDGVMCP